MSPGEKRDALARIEKCLREYRENLTALWDPAEAEEDLRELDRALSLLPRLRAVVNTLEEIADGEIREGDMVYRARNVLAALDGEEGKP